MMISIYIIIVISLIILEKNISCKNCTNRKTNRRSCRFSQIDGCKNNVDFTYFENKNADSEVRFQITLEKQ